MKVVYFMTDNREHDRTYDEKVPRFCAGVDALIKGMSDRSDIELHVISCTQRPLESPEKIASNIWYDSLLVPKLGWMRTLYQGCVRSTRRRIQDIKPQLVHGHGTERDCSICAVLSGFPNLVTIHGNMMAIARMSRPRIGSYLWLAARLEKFIVKRTNGVICNSRYTEDQVRSLAKKTWHVPHAVRPEFLSSPPEADKRPPVLLNAGVISPRKRQLELLDVAENLHRRGRKFEFRFIGFIPQRSDYSDRFLQRIKPMEAAGYASFRGAIPENELVNCFDSVAGVIHFPTEEAFGNVVVEALARNLKFFGTKTGGIIDIAQGAPATELIGANDWTALTNTIDRWLSQGHPLARGAAGYIQKKYSPGAVAESYIEIYKSLLKTP
jgi:glycosyltransferase involved in cell wall biosynthesis